MMSNNNKRYNLFIYLLKTYSPVNRTVTSGLFTSSNLTQVDRRRRRRKTTIIIMTTLTVTLTVIIIIVIRATRTITLGTTMIIII